MEAQKQRIVEEKAKLDKFIRELDALMGTPDYFALSVDKHLLLARQLNIRYSLSHVLAERIAAFQP